MADSLTAKDFLRCGHKWINRLIPFFRSSERREHGCWHQLFFAQVEYCDNLIFRPRAALDQLGDRLLDANRNLGRPDKLTVIFGRRITKQYSGKLQTEIEDLHLGNPVMRSYYKNGFSKHYVRDHLDHPRQLAVMSSLVRFSHVAAGGTFTTAELQAAAAEALAIPMEKFLRSALRIMEAPSQGSH
jgi:hypothetical protein